MGSKQTAQSNTSSSYSPPPDVLANYQAVTQTAQNVAATPYSAYSGQIVSPINNQQNAGIGAVNNASGIQDPYNTGATGLANSSAGAVNPTAFSADQLDQYENPYQNDVVNSTLAEIQNQNAQQAAQLQGNSISAGAFGGDRAGVAQAQLAGQQDLATNSTIAGLNAANFNNALSEFNTQQGVGLAAGQNNAARQLAASQELGTLGNTAQAEALTEANAQTNAGTLQQTTQQAQDTSAYNQFLQAQAYPFQTTGWLANIVEGIGSQSGGSSTGQTTQTGSTGGAGVGALLGLASFLKDGGRVNGDVPHKAGGGGLSTPYTGGLIDPTTGQPVGLGGGSVVPTLNLPVGHTMPTGGGPAVAAAPNQGQQAGQMSDAVKKLGTAVKNSPFAQQLKGLAGGAQPMALHPDDALSLAGDDAISGLGDDALASGGGDALGGLGALGGFFSGGGLVRRHFDDGGGVGGGGDGDGAPGGDNGGDGGPGEGNSGAAGPGGNGAGGHPTWMTPAVPAAAVAAPHAIVANPHPNAPSYFVSPVQMSDGTYTTTQDLAHGVIAPGLSSVAPLTFADGGLVRRKYADGGDVDLSPESLLADNWNPKALDLATALPTPEKALAARYSGPQMPVPPVALSPESQLSVAMGGQPGADTVPAPDPIDTERDRQWGKLVQAQSDTGLAALKTAMGGDSVAPAPSAPANPYGAIEAEPQFGANVPLPPVRPAGLGAADTTVTDATPTAPPLNIAPRGLAASATSAAPVQASGLANSAPVAPGNVGNPLGTLKSQIGSYESGNNYAAIGPETSTGDHAYGKYQVMGSNIPSWTKEAVGRSMTPAEFLHDQGAQEAVASLKLGQYLTQYGNPQDAASAWFTGKPLSEGANLKDVNGVSGSQYVANTVGGGRSGPPKWSDVLADNAEGSANIAARERAASGLAGYAPADTPVDGGVTAQSVPSDNGGVMGTVRHMLGTDTNPTNDGARSGLLGMNFSDAARQGLLSAGLGMMSGTSRSGLVNIGQGGLQGIAAYNNAKNLASEIGLKQAQTLGSLTGTQGADIENKIKQKQLDLMLGILDGHENSGTKRADAIAASPAVTTPTVTAPTVAPTKTVDPNFDPIALREKANKLAMIPAFKDAADKAAAQSAAIMNGEQQVRFTDGSVGYYPGVGEAKAEQAKRVAAAGEEAKVPAGTQAESQKAQLLARTDAFNKNNEGQSMLQQAQAVRDVMFDPKTGAPNINTGPLGDKIAHVAAIAEQLGISNPTVKMLTGTDPNNAQEVDKFKTALGSETARQDLTGNKVTQSEWNKFLQSVPGNQVLPGALKFLIDKSIIPKAQQQIGAYNAVKGMHPENGDDVQGAIAKYNAEHPWYTPGASSASSGVTPEMAAAELARRRLAKSQGAVQ